MSNEKITDKDKAMHFGACFVLAIIHPMLAVGASITKEYCDSKQQGNHWCWWDILADSLGIAVGVGVRVWIGW